MKFSDAPEFVRKKHALSQSHIGSAPGVEGNGVCAETALRWFYETLTTLDTKSSALMRLNGVLIAAEAFLLGLFDRQGGTILSTTPFESLVIITSALASAISIACCLFVVNVKWKFLEKVTLKEPGCDYDGEIRALDNECKRRQWVYQLAWWVSLIAVAEFVGEFIWQTVYVSSGLFNH